MSMLVLPGRAAAADRCPGQDERATDQNAAVVIQATLCLLNAERAGRGLAPLAWNWKLWAPAQRMAGAMVTYHFFEHVTPWGATVVDRVEPTGYLPNDDDWMLGENLAWGSAALSTAASIVNGWMNSPEHADNVLDPEYQDVGIGLAQGSPVDGGGLGAVFVADFGRSVSHASTSRSDKPDAPDKAVWKPREMSAGTLMPMRRRTRTRHFVRAARALATAYSRDG